MWNTVWFNKWTSLLKQGVSHSQGLWYKGREKMQMLRWIKQYRSSTPRPNRLKVLKLKFSIHYGCCLRTNNTNDQSAFMRSLKVMPSPLPKIAGFAELWNCEVSFSVRLQRCILYFYMLFCCSPTHVKSYLAYWRPSHEYILFKNNADELANLIGRSC